MTTTIEQLNTLLTEYEEHEGSRKIILITVRDNESNMVIDTEGPQDAIDLLEQAIENVQRGMN